MAECPLNLGFSVDFEYFVCYIDYVILLDRSSPIIHSTFILVVETSVRVFVGEIDIIIFYYTDHTMDWIKCRKKHQGASKS